MRAAVLVLSALLIGGCSNIPRGQPPPEQRATTVEDYDVPPDPMVDMGGPMAESAIVKDILKGPATGWRWTNQEPTVRVRVGDPTGLAMRAEFAVAEVNFKETGPITIQWMVNDKVLDTVRYTEHGQQVFEKDVPQGWLKPNADNTAGAKIDKVVVAKRDGVKLGIILTRIGFAY
jgi:hypothetical protein